MEFTQNLFTGSNTQYTIWLRGDNMEGKNYQLGLSTDPLCNKAVSWEVTWEDKLLVRYHQIFPRH